jgi:hypothetical protein
VKAGGSNTLTGDAASTPDQTALMRWQIMRRHVEDRVPLTTLATHEGIGLRTLQRWHAAHKRDGLSGLATANRGTTRRRSTPELVALVEGLALVKPPLSVAAISRKANRVAADHDWPPLSYSTVRSITTGLDPGMRTLGQQGAAAYRDTYELAWRHRAEPEHDLAGRPHRTGHPRPGREPETRAPVAHHDPGRLLPRDLRLHALPRSTVSYEHRTGTAAGDLAQSRRRVADVRDPRGSSVMKINELSTITDDVIEAARSTLVIGIS